MRPYLLPFAALILLHWLISSAAAESRAIDSEPQHAIVTSPGAPVRSGPGDSFYLTDTLPEDTEVEIYKRQDDGWCAIRPTAESFSWVFAQHVRVVNNAVAEIMKDDVAARVGSRLSSQRDVVQVRMKQGERVAILGQDDRDGGVWYKIAPPAGEFRWVHARDLHLEGVAAAADEERAVKTVALEELVDAPSSDMTPPPLAKVESTASASASGDQSGQWSPAKSTPPPADITPIGSAPASSAELSEHLQQLELRLSRMVAEPPATWHIAPLEQAAEQLLAHADSLREREAVKSTLAKIDRFNAIQRRYASAGLAATTPAAPFPVAQPSAGVATAATAPQVDATSGSPYDAVGILRPVVSRRPGAPQFALVNAQGQVVTFLTPTPDVNLQPYVGQQIGVSGSRGYIPEFRRAHVTAARVSPLNERMIR